MEINKKLLMAIVTNTPQGGVKRHCRASQRKKIVLLENL